MRVADRPRVEVLGPFRLILDGEETKVSRPQVRTVLAFLAASGRRWVSSSELIECLWPDDETADRSAALRTVLSRTRTALGDVAVSLESDGDRYRLVAETDLHDLDAVLELPSSEPDRLAQLEHVFGLLRGAPFVGVLDRDHVSGVIASAERKVERLCRETLVCLVDEGRYGQAVEIGMALVENNAEDEGAAVATAEALARLGRKSDAIGVLQKTRSVLRESGLFVDPAIDALETSILMGAIDLEVASSNPDGQPSDLFVGRQEEIAALTGDDQAMLVFIEGEAGIGKSALIDAVCTKRTAVGQECIVVAASASPDRPIQVFAEIVSELILQGFVPSEQHQSALSVLLPGEFDSAVRPSNREALVAGVVEVLSAAAHQRQIPIVIDDAHLLDAASLLVLKLLCDEESCRVVLAARPGHRDRLVDPQRLASAQLIELSALTDEDCRELVAASIPDAPSTMVANVRDRSGGNPLFLRLLIELAVDEVSPEDELPAAVLIAVQSRLDALSSSARRAIQTASVFGKKFSEHHLVSLTGSTRDALSEGVEIRVIQAVDDAGNYEFSHALVADAAYQLLSDGERVALHDQAGRVLELAGEGPMAIWAHCREARVLDEARALTMAGAAANQHLESFDWDGALECAEWGLQFVDDAAPGSYGSSHDLLIAAASAEMALGRPDSHFRLIDGARAARDAGDDDALVSATVELCNSGSVALTGIDIEPVLELVDASLSADVSDDQRVRLWAAAARSFMYSEHGYFGQKLYAKAFAAYPVCSPDLQELILRNSEAGLCNPKDFDLAKQATALMGEAAERNEELRWLAHWFAYRDALIGGDGDALASTMCNLRSEAPKSERRHAFVVLGQTFDMEMQKSWAEATFAMIHGDLDRAEEETNRALEVGLKQLAIRGDGFGEGWVTTAYGLLLLAIRHRQGRLAELVDLVETEAPMVPAWRVAIVITNHAAGNDERVRRELNVIAADDFALLVRDPTWTAATFLLAEPVAHHMGDAEAETLYKLMKPFEDRMSYSGLCTFGPMHDALAILANALGRTADADEHKRQATQLIAGLQADSEWAFTL